MKKFLSSEGMKSFLSSLLAIFLGLIFGYFVILLSKPDAVFEGFMTMLQGSFFDGARSLGNTLVNATPIMMTGLSVAFAYKCGLFNIGGPGQYIVGGFVSLYVAHTWTFIPQPIQWLVAILCGGLAGALVALIPGVLKAYKNVNIVISCIMMNYISMYTVNYLIPLTIYDPQMARTLKAPARAVIPKLGLDKIFVDSNANGGILIAILLCVIAYLIINKTTFGYELKACGYNAHASQYAGMNEKKCIVLSMVIAGFFSGIGGGLVYLAGTGAQISLVETLAAEGFNGIPVALLGLSNPIGVIFAALFIGHINLGGFYMQRYGFTPEIIQIVTSAIIYFSSFSLIVRLYIDRIRGKLKKKGGE